MAAIVSLNLVLEFRETLADILVNEDYDILRAFKGAHCAPSCTPHFQTSRYRGMVRFSFSKLKIQNEEIKCSYSTA